MPQLPLGVQYGVKYTLTGPDGTVAVFNDPTDPNYVGVLDPANCSGFDSPEVRENSDDLVQMDGGIHGDFFYGRRPVTLAGKIYNVATTTERNQKITLLQRATNAVRAVAGGTGPAAANGNARLTWTPDGGEQVFIDLRRQQPLRVTGPWDKDFQALMVAADPRIYSFSLYTTTVLASGGGGATGFGFPMTFPLSFGAASPTGQISAENQGDAISYPVLTLTGPGTNPTIVNNTTGERITLNYTLNAGETLVVDTLNKTILFNGNTPAYGALDYVNTQWWGLIPGVNDLRLLFFTFSAGASLRVDWRDAWL